MVGVVLVVHTQAVVLESVAHYEPVHVQTHVVAAYLVEDLLREGDVRCLVFHYHQRLGLPAEDHRVAALACGAHRDGHLVGDKPCGIALVGDEEMDEIRFRYFATKKQIEDIVEDMPFRHEQLNDVAVKSAVLLALNQNEYDISQDKALVDEIKQVIAQGMADT